MGDSEAERELAILERFNANCLCAPRNRLQNAVQLGIKPAEVIDSAERAVRKNFLSRTDSLGIVRCALAFLLAGCAANQPYHLGEAPTETAVTPAGSGSVKDIYRLG